MSRCRAITLTALACLFAAAPVRAQVAADDTRTVGSRTFFIPFTINAGEPPIQEVQLWVWKGGAWHWQAKALPTDRNIEVRVDADGLYNFAGRFTYRDGHAQPASTDQLQTTMRVLVDTEAPTINLEALPVQNGVAGIRWEVRDDNLDLKSLRLDYRYPAPPGQAQPAWLPLPESDQPRLASEQRGWKLGAGQRMEVRLVAQDLAKNTSEKSVWIGAPGETGSGVGYARNQGGSAAAGVSKPPMIVNTLRIKLEFDIEGIGPSGLDRAEPAKLWVRTRDDPTWKPDSAIVTPDNLVGVDGKTRATVTYNAAGEGVYGFTIIAKSGVGYSAPAPQSGMEPDRWVEVDMKPPLVASVRVTLNPDPSIRQVTILWQASDKNFGKEPIQLEYALTDTGSAWMPIANNLPNTGSYTWPVPESGPHMFYVRVRATDTAGNMGEAISPKVIVDQSRPRATIHDARPDGVPK